MTILDTFLMAACHLFILSDISIKVDPNFLARILISKTTFDIVFVYAAKFNLFCSAAGHQRGRGVGHADQGDHCRGWSHPAHSQVPHRQEGRGRHTHLSQEPLSKLEGYSYSLNITNVTKILLIHRCKYCFK